MTEENKTIQTENNPPVDEAAPPAPKPPEPTQSPTDNPPAPVPTKPETPEPPAPIEPPLDIKDYPTGQAETPEPTIPAEEPAALPMETELKQAIEPEQQLAAPTQEKTKQAEELPVEEIKPTPQIEIKTEQPTKPTAPPPTTPTIPPIQPKPAAEPIIPFITKFKNKLSEFRKQANQKRSEKVQKNLDKIMDYALKTQKVVNDDVEKLTGAKDDRATQYLNILVKKGYLIRFGKTSNIFYKPTNKSR